jgi:hypothetical protein
MRTFPAFVRALAVANAVVGISVCKHPPSSSLFSRFGFEMHQKVRRGEVWCTAFGLEVPLGHLH